MIAVTIARRALRLAGPAVRRATYVVGFGVSLILSCGLRAQTSPELQTVFITASDTIDAPANKTWRFVRDFARLPEIVPAGVSTCYRSGHPRNGSWVITLPNGKTIAEQTTAYSNRHRFLRYVMTDTPLPLADYVGTVQVTPLPDGRSRLTLEASYAAEPARLEALAAQIGGFQSAFLAGTQAHFSPTATLVAN